jgi:ribosome biogenesis GTPase
MQTLPGLVTRLLSGFFTVETGEGDFVCRLRGRLKQGRQDGDIAALGDRVEISVQSAGSGMIEKVLPRERALVRLDPMPRGVYRQILAANTDQVLLIFACADPLPHLRMLDRYLVICEKQEVPALIVANKVDLVGRPAAEALFAHYGPLGYPVIYTSVKQKTGLEELSALLEGKFSVFTGPSGVGKSSLLNAVQPGLGIAVNDVSGLTHKGRHTTVVRQMYKLEGGGYVADMPGMKALALWDTQPEEIDGYFPELRGLVEECQFNDCTHRREPGCAVRQAVADGRVHPDRYRSYLLLRYGEVEEISTTPS